VVIDKVKTGVSLVMPLASFQVLLPIAIDRPFNYTLPPDLSCNPGDFVEVPFRGKKTCGVVWGMEPTDYKGQQKNIVRRLNLPPLPAQAREFITWMATYNLCSLGMALKMTMPVSPESKSSFRKTLDIGTPHFNESAISLSPDQKEASHAIRDAIQGHVFKPFLLDGVTGSGKTEVYLLAMAAALEQSRQIVVMLPEIALTTQWLERFRRRFSVDPLLWHSGLPGGIRRQTWTAVLEGRAPVIVGARSSLFLPYANLGLIIVDEEHDASYKQEEQVIYQARDMAVVRAKIGNIPVVLASATPSVETVVNVDQGRYERLSLKNRHGGATLPDIDIIDMRLYSRTWIALPLQEAIGNALEAREQIMLFLNRRGYAPLTLCKDCGHRLLCPDCTAWLVEHKQKARLQCHHCGYYCKLPSLCPDCNKENSFIACGPGVERIYEEVTNLFPDARCEILTGDLLSTPDTVHQLFKRVVSHEIDIVIGTQILAKGHHFPMMTLVGVIDADLGLSGGDLRACERTYQLLHQVAGRAGREQRPGKVFLQTYNPEHPVMKALVSQDRDSFINAEKSEREARLMPPFGRLGAVIISGKQAFEVERAAKGLARSAPVHPAVTILGPVPAPLSRLRGRYRWRFLVKAAKTVNLQEFMTNWIHPPKSPTGNPRSTIKAGIRVAIDIDPYNFL
jgi:primosomal protein N' (replication factor Y)